MPPKSHHPLVEDFMASLAGQAQRATGPRWTVSRAVARQRGHFTVDELSEGLPMVGRATVYRTVKLMVELGFVCRVLLNDGSLRYQVSHKGHHHHMICTECGQSRDLVGCDIPDMLREKTAQRGFVMRGHWLEVYGLCQACAETAIVA